MKYRFKGFCLAFSFMTCLVFSSCGGRASTISSSLSSSSLFNLSRNLSSYFETGKNVIVHTMVEWEAPASSVPLLSHRYHTPLWHYHGSTYLVWADSRHRPWLTQLTDGRVATVPLDPLADYVAQADSHNRFSIGIDRNGYIHVTGDMHNYSTESVYATSNTFYLPRYQKQRILYWKSKQPASVAGGFTFVGGKDDARAIPGAGWTYGKFFTDNQGELYYSSRVRAIEAGHWPGEMGLGLYKYDIGSARWEARGGLPDQLRPGNLNKVILWENAGLGEGDRKWYQGFIANFKFDSLNRLHFAASINSDMSLNGSNRLVYAVSNDGGVTWNKANGARIPGLPIRAADNVPNQGDIVADAKASPFFGSEVDVVTDKNGKPGVVVDSLWRTWSGSGWVSNNAINFDTLPRPSNGNLNQNNDLFLTLTSTAAILRAKSFDSPMYGYDFSGYKSYQCVSGYGLETTGVAYGVGVKDNIPSILKTTITPAPLPCGWNNNDIAATLPGYVGTAGYADGQFVVTNYGVSLDNSDDSFHYVYKPMSGDGFIITKVTSNSPSNHTRAGVMMRETLASNSRHVMATIAPAAAGRGAIFGHRRVTGGGTSNSSLAGISTPYWIKLVRSHDTFTGSISPDGITWTETGKVSIPMSKTIYVGLASASYHRYGMQTSIFENVNAPAFHLNNQACE